MSKVYKQKGFTLIELLVVIAVIGILSSVVLASLNSARKKGADAKIKAELKQIATALEMYYDKYGTYVVAGSGHGSNGGPTSGCGCGWAAYEDSGAYAKSVTTKLAEEGFLGRVSQQNPPNYMVYNCSADSYAVSATINNPTAQDISTAASMCGFPGGYGKNYSVGK